MWPTVKKWRFNGFEHVPIVVGPDGTEIEAVWAAQWGSQAAFLAARETEVIFVGTRAGCGKSDALLFSFLQYVGRGFGSAWKGVIFRRFSPDQREMIGRSKLWIPRLWPQSQYNEIKFRWEFPQGEELYLGHLAEPADFQSWMGHQFPFVGFEELVTWPNLECYMRTFSMLRTSLPGVPKMMRATTNPYGPAHNAIKQRFNLPIPNAKSMTNPNGAFLGPVIEGKVTPDGLQEPTRRAIHGHVLENKIFLRNNPDYIPNLRASVAHNSDMERAWIDGDWDITAGGLLDDIWGKCRRYALVGGLTFGSIPAWWRIFRAYDYGNSSPFAVGWFAISDGSDLILNSGQTMRTVRGDLFLIKEWYGSTGKPNEGLRLLPGQVRDGIIEREIDWGWRDSSSGKCRVRRGPADTGIFDDNNGVNISEEFLRPSRVRGYYWRGVQWEKADKTGENPRRQGLNELRQLLYATIPPAEGALRERPGLFISPECVAWLQTVPVLPRDPKDPEDCPKNSEDHCYDMTRYAIRYENRTARFSSLNSRSGRVPHDTPGVPPPRPARGTLPRAAIRA